MRKTTFFIFCILYCTAHKALSQQQLDSIALSFHSPFEKEAFQHISGQRINFNEILALLLAVEPENGPKQVYEAQQDISTLIGALDAQKIIGKKYKKSVAIIFDLVHERQLIQYDIHAQFKDLFSKGTYNCATASALYALLLEHYQIPYTLLEYPNHINIIVDPGGENIVLESTDPVSGIYNADKMDIVQSLIDQKLIPEAQYTGKSTEELYDAYFAESERKIDFVQLTGALYYNAAYFAFEAEKFEIALNLLQKSLRLSPNKWREKMRLMILYNLLLKASYDKPESFNVLFVLYGLEQTHEKASKLILDEFRGACLEFLLNNHKPEQYQALYRYFSSKLEKDRALLLEIRFIHHLENGTNLALRSHNKQALFHWDSAYQIKPEHPALQGYITEAVHSQFNSVWSNPERLNEELHTWVPKFPFLENTPTVHQTRLYQAGMAVIANFEKGETDAGFKAFTKFEKHLKTMEEQGSFFEAMVGATYGNISSYYVRKDDLIKAEEWLQKGLAIVPTSEELRRKKEAIDDYKIRYGRPQRKH